MKILQTVTIKQRLTENSKKQLQEKFTQRKQLLEREISQLKFEMKKMEKSRKYPSITLKTYFEKEINDRNEKIKILDFQLEQLEILPIGSELKEREIQGILEINVGDNWNELQHGKTVIIKDGIIEEII